MSYKLVNIQVSFSNTPKTHTTVRSTLASTRRRSVAPTHSYPDS